MPGHFSLDDIQNKLEQAGLDCDIYQNSQAKSVRPEKWKIVHDGSIVCRRGDPNCITFELVSPILFGGDGLSEIHTLLTALSRVEGVQVNASAG